ncbi:MAG TPA: sugar phosphate nucleotidyltransferase [Stellaceae bacterium]|nr:sugar phosphate nucleotidyltransferase [Stellaceae bacterium]
MNASADSRARPEPGLSGIDVAVLAGGLGTRVATALGELPKILAPAGGRPFLEHLLDWLQAQGVRRVVLCLGHRAAPVLDHLRRAPRAGLDVVCSVEPEPLGTAGALAHARPLLRSDPVLAMNGDTLAQVDLAAFLAAFHARRAGVALVGAAVDEPGRYGRMEIGEDGRVMRFREKEDAGAPPYWISAGIYLLGRQALDEIAALGKGSLERDFLERRPAGSIHAFRIAGRFLDIGTPETLALARDGVGGYGAGAA